MTYQGQRICQYSERIEEIVPKFMRLIDEENPTLCGELLKSCPSEFVQDGHFLGLPPDDVLWKTDQMFWWFHEDLWSAMERLSPSGCHFGVQLAGGDRGWYGYWPEKLVTKETL